MATPLLLPSQAQAAEGKVRSIQSLGTFERADQRNMLQARANKYLSEVISKDDAPAAVRLALHDAGTYDIATKTGGFDGSVVLSR